MVVNNAVLHVPRHWPWDPRQAWLFHSLTAATTRTPLEFDKHGRLVQDSRLPHGYWNVFLSLRLSVRLFLGRFFLLLSPYLTPSKYVAVRRPSNSSITTRIDGRRLFSLYVACVLVQYGWLLRFFRMSRPVSDTNLKFYHEPAMQYRICFFFVYWWNGRKYGILSKSSSLVFVEPLSNSLDIDKWHPSIN